MRWTITWMKSDQLRLRWDIGQFRGLDALLAEARLSDRAVVFASDHGHILDQDTRDAGREPQRRLARAESGVLSRRNHAQGHPDQGR